MQTVEGVPSLLHAVGNCLSLKFAVANDSAYVCMLFSDRELDGPSDCRYLQPSVSLDAKDSALQCLFD